MEDPDIVIDPCEIHCGRTSKFDVFWDECAHFCRRILTWLLMSEDTPR